MCWNCVKGVLVALGLLLASCGDRPGPQDAIRNLVSAMETAVEEGALGGAAGLLHADYSDPTHADKKAALRSLFVYLRRHQAIHLLVRVQRIVLQQSQREAHLVAFVAMTGVPVESPGLIPIEADLYRFDVDLQTDAAGEWRFTGARWRPAKRSDFGL